MKMEFVKMIVDKIQKYKYVSFDIFDTLILRNVNSPKDIFKIVQINIDPKRCCIKDFFNKRVNAELEAINKNTKKEICLEDIYSNIKFKSSREKDYVMNLEKMAEVKYSIFNPEFREIIEFCKRNSKKIILASDMYLDENTIKKILNKNQVYYDFLFISNSIQARKSRGYMYKYILAKLKISNSDIIHIGDNKISDFIIPKLIGIKSILYKTNSEKLVSKRNYNLAENICFSYIKNKSLKKENSYYKIGFNIFGVLLYSMCKWIHYEAEANNINDIYFLARDGYIIKKAYDYLYKNCTSNYLYVSRRSLTVPMLVDSNSIQDVIEKVPYIKRNETMKTFMNKLGIDDDEFISKLIGDFGDNIDRNDLLNNKYDKLFDIVLQELHFNAQKEYENCIGYLKQNIKSKEFIVVDIGWYGTIQKCLEKLLYKTNEGYYIYGCYLGIIPKDDGKDNLKNAAGYIYDYKNTNKYNPKLIFGFNGLIETFFTANHGSVKKYKKKSTGDYVPILEAWEKENWDIVREVHEGALDFVKEIDELLVNINLEISKEAAYKGINDLFTKPTLKDVDTFKNITFFDAYYKKIVNYKGYLYYIKNLKMLLEDFFTSNWKIGFLKKLIKVKLPIDKVYLLMIRLKDSK